jgi:hypothetical protein
VGALDVDDGHVRFVVERGVDDASAPRGAQPVAAERCARVIELSISSRQEAMRLSFVNGGHRDLVVTSGGVNLGSADGNDVVVDGKDVSPWHARIVVDARGIVLQVLDPAAQTHVNARPVREKRSCAAATCCTSATPRSPSRPMTTFCRPRCPRPSPAIPRTGHASCCAAVGCERGQGDFGRRARRDRQRPRCRHRRRRCTPRVASRGRRNHRRRHLAAWRRRTSRSHVNGIETRDARLFPGDQVAFARHHFIVEAPGFGHRIEPDPAAGEADAASASAEAANSDSGSGVWWLIGVAAVIAAGLYLLIHRGF